MAAVSAATLGSLLRKGGGLNQSLEELKASQELEGHFTGQLQQLESRLTDKAEEVKASEKEGSAQMEGRMQGSLQQLQHRMEELRQAAERPQREWQQDTERR